MEETVVSVEDTKITVEETKVDVEETKINVEEIKVNLEDTKVNLEDATGNENDSKVDLKDFKAVCRGCLTDVSKGPSFLLEDVFREANIIGDYLKKRTTADPVSNEIKILRPMNPQIMPFLHNDQFKPDLHLLQELLPKQLCEQCTADIKRCQTFFAKRLKSEQVLLAVLKQNETKVKMEVDETPNKEDDSVTKPEEVLIKTEIPDEDPETAEEAVDPLAKVTPVVAPVVPIKQEVEIKEEPQDVIEETYVLEEEAEGPKEVEKHRCDDCDITFGTLKEYRSHRRKVKHPKTKRQAKGAAKN